MYSPDWKTVTELPILQAEVEHGLKKDVQNYEIVAKYNNKVYVVSYENDTRGYYYLNTDTMTWEAAQPDLNKILIGSNNFDCRNNHINLFATNIIGRYWFVIGQKGAVTTVYDMETDTIVATLSTGFYVYDGKGYDFGLRDGVLTKRQYPGDGSDAIVETVLDTGDKKLNISGGDGSFAFPFDEQYYAYKDNYGVFLREYGKGEDGEITIVMFEQK